MSKQSDYQKAYRENMTRRGFKKTEVWVPAPFLPEIRRHAEHLRDLFNSPFEKETDMWNTTLLAEALAGLDAVKSGDWKVEVIEGSTSCLALTLTSLGDLSMVVVPGQDQILMSVLLFPVQDISDQAGFNDMLLRTHKMLPLSTAGITRGPDGTDWYELFGALSARSSNESVITEIETLADNVIEAVEAYSTFLKPAQAA